MPYNIQLIMSVWGRVIHPDYDTNDGPISAVYTNGYNGNATMLSFPNIESHDLHLHLHETIKSISTKFYNNLNLPDGKWFGRPDIYATHMRDVWLFSWAYQLLKKFGVRYITDDILLTMNQVEDHIGLPRTLRN